MDFDVVIDYHNGTYRIDPWDNSSVTTPSFSRHGTLSPEK